jgi:hypothetical protein
MDVFGPLGWVIAIVLAVTILLIRDRFTIIGCPECDAQLEKGTEVCSFCGYDFVEEQRPWADRPPGPVDLHLETDRATSFDRAVLNYEFPQISDDEWDSNWLLVRMEGRQPRNSWTQVSSCLLTWDLQALAEWFDVMAEGREPPSLRFTEPVLNFVAGGHVDGRAKIVVEVVLEPPVRSRPEDVELPLFIEREQLREAAASLRRAAERFPVRGPRPSTGRLGS